MSNRWLQIYQIMENIKPEIAIWPAMKTEQPAIILSWGKPCYVIKPISYFTYRKPFVVKPLTYFHSPYGCWAQRVPHLHQVVRVPHVLRLLRDQDHLTEKEKEIREYTSKL